MSNNYHLALQPPEPNLVEGMRWLQSTFETRFDRFRNDRGHVCQGRYKSLLFSEVRPLLELINDIHLNPVQAKLCTVDELKAMNAPATLNILRGTWRLHRIARLYHSCATCLCTLGEMRKYTRLLKLTEKSDPKQNEAMASQYWLGWFAGSEEARLALAKDLKNGKLNVDWKGVDLKDLNALNWERIVQTELKRLKIKECQIATNPKGAEWKVQIAKRLRKETTAKNL